MENRGTGLTPNRLPSEWEKRPLEMTREPDQGPGKESHPTMRDLQSAQLDTSPASFTDQLIASRAGVQAQTAEARAVGVFPGDVVTVLAHGQGGMIAQHLAGVGSFDSERSKPGDDGNVAIGGAGGLELPKGSATKTTGKPIMGKTQPRGTV